jgi:hypothetical protein
LIPEQPKAFRPEDKIMFRKLMLATVAALALLTPLTGISQVQAHSSKGHYRVYPVYYRARGCDPWSYYASYSRYADADYAVRYLQYYGYEGYIGG